MPPTKTPPQLEYAIPSVVSGLPCQPGISILRIPPTPSSNLSSDILLDSTFKNLIRAGGLVPGKAVFKVRLETHLLSRYKNGVRLLQFVEVGKTQKSFIELKVDVASYIRRTHSPVLSLMSIRMLGQGFDNSPHLKDKVPHEKLHITPNNNILSAPCLQLNEILEQYPVIQVIWDEGDKARRNNRQSLANCVTPWIEALRPPSTVDYTDPIEQAAINDSRIYNANGDICSIPDSGVYTSVLESPITLGNDFERLCIQANNTRERTVPLAKSM
mmetsp:Transcript_28901/g.48601  ORF Transcript_28901/g.48601 Transcript_28901/m.48601 type:complete len:272 (+) Transcript_28901:14-829(+)